MSVMLDIIGASVIVGMVIIMIMNVNINLTDENYKGIVELNTQTQTIQLARIIEFDYYKIGYMVPAAQRPAITNADSTYIRFKSNLADKAGAIDIIEYGLGDFVAQSPNPRDRMLFRIENVTKVFINYSIVQFKLEYFDSTDSKLSTPITGANLNRIKSVYVLLKLESPQPFDTTFSRQTYAHAMYQKLIYPRNL